MSHFPPSRTQSADYFRHRGLFDQTPTTLRPFLTSLTSNVWHSRLAADQRSTPRRGPTGPGQMPLHVGPDHMNVGPDWGPQRAAPPTYIASHQSLKINSRKDIRGHQEQGGVFAAQVWRKRGFVVPGQASCRFQHYTEFLVQSSEIDKCSDAHKHT